MLPRRGATGAERNEPANPKYRLLAPVSVTLMKDTTQPIGAECTGYIHVTDVPTRPGWAALTTDEVLARINGRICRMWEGSSERRIWQGIASSIPLAARNALMSDRQLTVTWTQFKSYMQHLVELRTMTDEDLD